MPSQSSTRDRRVSRAEKYLLALHVIFPFQKQRDDMWNKWLINPPHLTLLKIWHTWDSVTLPKLHTWPSQRSMSGTFSRLALMSLVWNNFPSKYIHGQQCSHGIGCPQASFAKSAISTPLINKADSWIPRGSRFSICFKKKIVNLVR